MRFAFRLHSFPNDCLSGKAPERHNNDLYRIRQMPLNSIDQIEAFCGHKQTPLPENIRQELSRGTIKRYQLAPLRSSISPQRCLLSRKDGLRRKSTKGPGTESSVNSVFSVVNFPAT